MILKLLRYDFRGVAKRLLPIYVLVLALSVINRISFTMGMADMPERFPNWIKILSELFFAIQFISIAAIFIMTTVVMVSKYSKSVFGEEGYLTNTLPISQSKIILSKTLNFWVWMLLGTLVSFASLMISFFQMEMFAEIWPQLQEVLRALMEYIQMEGAGAAIMGILILSISPFQSVLLMYLSVAIGHQFKYPMPAGIVAYLVISTIGGYIGQITGSSVTSRFVDYSSGFGNPMVTPILGVMLLVMVASTVAYFFGTKYIQEKMLNLE